MSDRMRVATIPGDGIGVDVTREAVKVMDSATGGRIEWTEFDYSCERYAKTGAMMPPRRADDARRI